MSASSDTALLACTANAWQGEQHRCRWCNAELTGRQSRWCSQRCVDAFGENHWWTHAARAAGERDDWKCARCGERGTQVHHLIPLHTIDTSSPIFADAYWYRAGKRRKVKHQDSGCWHHLEGLETLCDDCHHAAHHPPGPPDGQLSMGIEAA